MWSHPAWQFALFMASLMVAGMGPSREIGEWLIFGGGFGLLLALWTVAWSRWGKTKNAPGAIQMVNLPAAPGRVYVGREITPKYLLSFFRENTQVHANNAILIYIGKWIAVKGSVKQISSPSADSALVQIDIPFSTDLAAMRFEGAEMQKATILRKGNAIIVAGKIDRVENITLRLDNCEIVSSKP